MDKEIFERHKKHLFNLDFHLEIYLTELEETINTWSVNQLREEILRKISHFKEVGYTDVFHPCIDNNILIKKK